MTDSFYDKVQPVPGFIFPESGDEVVCMHDYATAAARSQPPYAVYRSPESYKDYGVLKTGTVGVVTGNRYPGTHGWGEGKESGYIGCVVKFNSAAMGGAYPAGIVLRWDDVSDPEKFVFRKPATTPVAGK